MRYSRIVIIVFLMLATGMMTLYGQAMGMNDNFPLDGHNRGNGSWDRDTGYFVDFEGPGETKTTYTSGNVTLSGKSWNLNNVLIGTADNDMKNGLRSARFRHQDDQSAIMTMQEDKPNGIGTISFLYARSDFSGDRQPTAPVFVVEYSLDGGADWTQIGSNIDLDGVDNLTYYSQTVNVEGNVRLRFRTISGTDGRRFNIDDILVTDFGDEESVVMPSFTPSGGSYYGSVTVSISTITPNATIYYTTDGTDPDESSAVYSDPIEITETTTLKARAYAPEMNPSLISSAVYTIITPVAISSIAELRGSPQDGTLYRLTGEVILTFRQSFRNQKYIQDDTAAILIDDDTGVLTTSYNIGDGITNLTGTLGSFGNMMQFNPVTDAGPATSIGNVIIPEVITAQDFAGNYPDYDARLLTIRNVSFIDADGSAEFQNGVVYQISDGTATIDFRATFYGVDYIGTTIPQEAIDLTGLANARTTPPEGFFISSRSSEDFAEFLPPNTVAPPTFIPAGGQYLEPVDVTLSTLTEDASIYYTTDGSEPTQNSLLYTTPIHVSETMTIRARAFKSGMNPSSIAIAIYQIGYTRIKDIRENFSYWDGRTVTVQGVVMIGSGTIHGTQLRAYMQDDPIIEPAAENQRGIMLFDYNADSNIQRGHRLLVTGVVGEYGGAVQLTNFTYQILETGVDFEKYVLHLSITEAQNFQRWEGTTVQIEGTLYENPFYAGGGHNVNIEDVTGRRYTVRVWDSTGINVSRLERGVPIQARGAVGVFANAAQLLPGYQDDIVIDIAEPVVEEIHWEPEKPYVDEDITVRVTAFDYDGFVETVRLTYRLESESAVRDTLDMNHIGNDVYSADLPSLVSLDITYEDNYIITITATDDDGNTTSKSERIRITKRRPIVSNVVFGSPQPGDSLSVQVNITTPALDPEVVITTTRIYYYLNYRAKRYEAKLEADTLSVDLYKGYIPGQPQGTIVQVAIYAEDSVDLFTEERLDEDGNELIYTYPVESHRALLRIPAKPFNPWEGETISIGFFSEDGNKAILRIYNSEGKLMFTPRNLILDSVNQDGVNYYHWNGRDRNNRILPIGLYICHLEVIDIETGKKKTANAPIVIGSPLK